MVLYVRNTTVLFEDLFRGSRKVESHAEVQDEDQTVYFPKVKTQVSNHTVKPNKNNKNQNTIEYFGFYFTYLVPKFYPRIT